MITLVTGGADSGKSEYAERIVTEKSDMANRLYIATMEKSPAAAERIARHKKRRTGLGFSTIECCRDIGAIDIVPHVTALFEDVPNLVANEMFGGDVSRIESGLSYLMEACEDICFVTGDIASAGADYGDETIEYMKLLSHVNSYIASRADEVIEVVCGLPDIIKGEKDDSYSGGR